MARCTKKWSSGNAGTETVVARVLSEIANVILGASSDTIMTFQALGYWLKGEQVQFVESNKGASNNRTMGRLCSDRKKMQRERESLSARISIILRRLRHVRWIFCSLEDREKEIMGNLCISGLGEP